MPKEISHWTLAAALAEDLPEDSLFYAPIHSFPNLFFLGAIAPDIPFYYLAGPHRSSVQKLADSLHKGEAHSLVPVLAFLDQNPDPAARAFAAGVICHLLADTLFHPLVYYFSGKEGLHAGATARHRQFETALDIHLSYLYRPRVSLARVVSDLEVTTKRRNHFLGHLFQVESPRQAASLGAALNFFLMLQALFRSSLVCRVCGVLNKNTPWVPDEVTGLIYPCKRGVSLPFFTRKFQYQDAFTGAVLSTSILTLVKETTRAGKMILTLLSEILGQGQSATGVMDNPGLPKIRPDLPKEGFFFWQGKTHLEPDLYRGLDLKCLPIRNRRSHDR